jgi:hypothetical protein
VATYGRFWVATEGWVGFRFCGNLALSLKSREMRANLSAKFAKQCASVFDTGSLTPDLYLLTPDLRWCVAVPGAVSGHDHGSGDGFGDSSIKLVGCQTSGGESEGPELGGVRVLCSFSPEALSVSQVRWVALQKSLCSVQVVIGKCGSRCERRLDLKALSRYEGNSASQLPLTSP